MISIIRLQFLKEISIFPISQFCGLLETNYRESLFSRQSQFLPLIMTSTKEAYQTLCSKEGNSGTCQINGRQA
jgi:hypothetical protein